MASISGKADPVVRTITFNDITDALADGIRDFKAAPKVGLFFGTLYALGGIFILLSLTYLNMTYLAYPMAAGFAILGPFAAAGIYEASRRLETGEPQSIRSIWRYIVGRSEIRWMAFVPLFIFIMWMYEVRLVMALTLGYATSIATLGDFLTTIFTTRDGLMFLGVGTVVGGVLALILFALTVVSFPLVLDREVDFVTAMITSIRAVGNNAMPMLIWAVIVVLLMFAAMVPMFLGLIIVLPVLGHTTWHLYKRVVAPLK